MIIFAVGNNNDNNNKDSILLAYMQIRPGLNEAQMSAQTGRSPQSVTMTEGSGLSCEVLTDIARVPISTTLRKLNIGQSVEFPIEQRTSLLVIANRIKRELARIGWDYEYADDEEKFVVIFTRKK